MLMHVHYTFIREYMRTTIDIPNDLRQKLITEAARRNLKGFSLLVTEALKDYFNTKRNNREETIVKLKGCRDLYTPAG